MRIELAPVLDPIGFISLAVLLIAIAANVLTYRILPGYVAAAGMTTLQFAAVLNTMLESASRTVYAAAVTMIGGLSAIGPLTPNLVLDDTLPSDTFPVGLIFNPTRPNPLERTTYPLALPPIGLPVPL